MYDAQAYIDIEGIFAGIEPTEVYQQTQFNPARPQVHVGSNDLQKAKAAQYTYHIDQSRHQNIDKNAYLGFEENLH